MSPVRTFEALRLSEAERDAFLARVRPGVSPQDYRMIEAMSYALPQTWVH